MKEYLALSIGCLGIIWFAGSMSILGYPNEKNRLLKIIGLASTTFLFINNLPFIFTTVQSATPTALFDFIGRILGLIGCAIGLHSFSPKKSLISASGQQQSLR